MKLFDKILCPIDFSQTSVKALQWAEYLAKKFHSEVIVLYVMEVYPIGTPADIGLDYEQYQRTVLTNFNDFLSPLTIKYEKMMSTGNPAHKIAALAKGLHASVIVMGTRGKLGAAHKLLGSTAESVVRSSSVPVLTISAHCELPKPHEERKILVPLVSLHRVPRGVLRFRKILRELNCIPTFLHVVDFQDEMFNASFNANPFLVSTHEAREKTELLSRIGYLIQKNGNDTSSVVHFGNVGKEIVKELENNHYDYVLLGVRKKNLLTRFVETNAYQVISQSPVPVITLKNE